MQLSKHFLRIATFWCASTANNATTFFLNKCMLCYARVVNLSWYRVCTSNNSSVDPRGKSWLQSSQTYSPYNRCLFFSSFSFTWIYLLYLFLHSFGVVPLFMHFLMIYSLLSTDQSIMQLINHWTNQSVNQLINQLVNQPTNQSTNKPVNQPTNQSTNKPVNQPTNQSTNQSTKQPISQPTSQPTKYSTDQPTSQPTHQSINQPTNKRKRWTTLAKTNSLLCDISFWYQKRIISFMYIFV